MLDPELGEICSQLPPDEVDVEAVQVKLPPPLLVIAKVALGGLDPCGVENGSDEGLTARPGMIKVTGMVACIVGESTVVTVIDP